MIKLVEMNSREDVGTPSKPLAHRLAAMIESGLLRWREYAPWTDALIMKIEHPPVWILDLSVTKYRPDAELIAANFAHSEPAEELSWDERTDDYIASVYLRYERRELSWATFLTMAGKEADANGGKNECEYFYAM